MNYAALMKTDVMYTAIVYILAQWSESGVPHIPGNYKFIRDNAAYRCGNSFTCRALGTSRSYFESISNQMQENQVEPGWNLKIMKAFDKGSASPTLHSLK